MVPVGSAKVGATQTYIPQTLLGTEAVMKGTIMFLGQWVYLNSLAEILIDMCNASGKTRPHEIAFHTLGLEQDE